ncbi:HpcH/HpaI aldolase family protein [Kiloniella laminariae]|uniref:HpcH/HpaI aldolase family protein n=1 Tax=Kiloniella laminariae TaxID=454162 RepID=UPI0003A1DEAC|nr:aldolase/citrate lyase family protein [Kiloniella laminariae]
MSHQIKRKLANKESTIGSWLSIPNVNITEMMARLGQFEWLVVDMEHTGISSETMGQMIQVIDLAGVSAFVRVGSNDPLQIKRALDCGAKGIIVPQVNSREEAQRVVDSVYYPPIGKRGVGLFRAQGYGTSFDYYKENVAPEIVVIVQIEHKDAVDQLDEIVSVPGVDAFMIGPYDLSGSFGKPGDFTAPEVAASLNKAKRFCQTSDKAGGIHVVHTDRASLASNIEQGFRFIAYGTDMIFLAEKLSEVTTDLKIVTNKY